MLGEEITQEAPSGQSSAREPSSRSHCKCAQDCVRPRAQGPARGHLTAGLALHRRDRAPRARQRGAR
eukprot:1102964-Prymnesium_polylepis.2